MKTACVLRWGALGDMIMSTVLIRALKEDGYHVTVNTTERGIDILKHDPHIDEFVKYVDNTVPNEELGEYWDKLAEGYDKFVNLSESIEGALIRIEGRPEFYLSKEDRHEQCNVNYYDHTLAVGGYEGIKGRNAELYFSESEERRAREFKRKYKDKFLVVWALSGSAFHKVYPYGQDVVRAFVETHPDAIVATVGGIFETAGKWAKHPQIKYYANRWPLRKTMSVVKNADLVISPETSIAVAAGCFKVPKIIMLSHASEENLTKYWENCQTLYSKTTSCYPCHQLHNTLDTCKLDRLLGTPECMATIGPASILNAMQTVYEEWEKRKRGN
jgi:ADP-heptose:LPS heptosyltransferase